MQLKTMRDVSLKYFKFLKHTETCVLILSIYRKTFLVEFLFPQQISV